MGYTDNLKGFRRRCMIKKLDILMKQIEDGIEYCYEEAMFEDSFDKRDDIENAQYMKERIEELESQFSMIWRIKIQLDKGIRTSREDLKYVNEVHKQIALWIYYLGGCVLNLNGNSQRTRLRRMNQDDGRRVVDQSSHSVTNCYNLIVGILVESPDIIV